MNHRAFLCCLLAILPVFGGSPPAAMAESREEGDECIIVMYDASSSMGTLPEPDTAQAFITELIHVASISGRSVKMAVILFNGNGVKVLGDDDNMPTAALASLHKKVLEEWEKPFGATPCDEALQQCVRIARAVSSEAKVTVINFGDGHPGSGRLRPDDFEEVQQKMDSRIEAIRKLGYPPKTTQKLIDRFLAAVRTPGTEESKEVYEKVQLKAEFELCERHAAALKASKVRFVSVDFAGGIEPLRKIHESAGGLDADYLIVQPANQVIKRLHDLRVTQLDGIVVPRPVHLPAHPTTFQTDYEHRLDQVGEAALVTIVFHRPIEAFEQHCELSVDAGGVTYRFDVQNTDPTAILSYDSAGKVATATLVLPSMPADGKVTVHFRSPGFSMHSPEMTVFTHLRLSSDLEPVFRPEHVQADRRPPYTLDPDREVNWVAWIGVKDDPKPIPLRGIEPVWQNRLDGRTTRIELEPDQQTPGMFRSANKSRIPAGQFDLEVNYILESGAQFRLMIRAHVQSKHSDEFVAIELDESGRSSDHFAFGEVGDALRQAEVKALVRSMNVDYPITVEFSVVGLVDPTGQSPQRVWVLPTRRQLTLQPGRAHPLTLKLELPDLIENALEDGVFTAQLQCSRLDLDAVMDVRPLGGAPSAGGRNVDEITFTLRRPRFSLRVPRGPKDELERRGEQVRLSLHVDFGVPFRRSVVVKVRHDSNEMRQVELRVLDFEDRQGRHVPMDKLSLLLAEGCQAKQAVEPGGTAVFRLVLDVAEAVDCQAVLRISANGLRTVEVPVDIRPRRHLFGKTVQRTCYGLALLLLPLAALAFVRRMGVARYGAGQELTITSQKGFLGITAEAARGEKIRFFFDRPWKWKWAGETREKTLNRQLLVPANDLTPRNPATLTDEDQTHLGLNEGYITDDGGIEVHGEVIEAEKHDKRIARHGRSLRRRFVVATVCLLVGYFFFSLPVLGAVQWLWDVIAH